MKLIDKLKLCLRIIKNKNSSIMRHASDELALLGDDEMQSAANKDIKELLLVASTQGHSGFSINYVFDVVNNLRQYRPLTPLTGKNDEWADLGGGRYQNKRCSAVFKDNGEFEYIYAYVFVEKNGSGYTNGVLSSKTIDFPYMPKTEYIKEGSLKYYWFRLNRFFGLV